MKKYVAPSRGTVSSRVFFSRLIFVFFNNVAAFQVFSNVSHVVPIRFSDEKKDKNIRQNIASIFL